MLFLKSSFVSSRSSHKSDEARSAGWDCENNGPLKCIYFKYIYMLFGLECHLGKVQEYACILYMSF